MQIINTYLLCWNQFGKRYILWIVLKLIKPSKESKIGTYEPITIRNNKVQVMANLQVKLESESNRTFFSPMVMQLKDRLQKEIIEMILQYLSETQIGGVFSVMLSCVVPKYLAPIFFL